MGVESSEFRSLPSSIATDTITSTSGRQTEKWEWKYWYSRVQLESSDEGCASCLETHCFDWEMKE